MIIIVIIIIINKNNNKNNIVEILVVFATVSVIHASISYKSYKLSLLNVYKLKKYQTFFQISLSSYIYYEFLYFHFVIFNCPNRMGGANF